MKDNFFRRDDSEEEEAEEIARKAVEIVADIFTTAGIIASPDELKEISPQELAGRIENFKTDLREKNIDPDLYFLKLLQSRRDENKKQ